MVAPLPLFIAEADRLETSSSRKDSHERGPAGGSPGASNSSSFRSRMILFVEVLVFGALQVVAVIGIVRFLLG